MSFLFHLDWFIPPSLPPPPHNTKKTKLYELVGERLYDLVGETYISMSRSGNVYISMQVGVAVIGEWTFGECPIGKNTWCRLTLHLENANANVLINIK